MGAIILCVLFPAWDASSDSYFSYLAITGEIIVRPRRVSCCFKWSLCSVFFSRPTIYAAPHYWVISKGVCLPRVATDG
jgi:hypothetical protein